MPQVAYEEKLFAQQCCNCGITFGVLNDFDDRRRKDHKSFYCPNGHPREPIRLVARKAGLPEHEVYPVRKGCDELCAAVSKGQLSRQDAVQRIDQLLPRKGRRGRPRKK